MSSPTQAAVPLGLASVSAYPMASARPASFRVDGSPSWSSLRVLANASSPESANLNINMTANALFLVDGGEVAGVVTTISCFSGLERSEVEDVVTLSLLTTPFH